MNKKDKIILFTFAVITIHLFQSCSSAIETETEEKKIRYEEKAKVIKNLDLAERKLLSSLNISTIEKVGFNLDSEGKPLNNNKLSTQNYNHNGFLTETIIYDKKGKIEYKYTYDYNSSGKRVRTTRYYNEVLSNYYKYDYNEYGNKVRAYRYDKEGKLEEYYNYEYDDDGNLVDEEWYSSSGEKIYSVENNYENGIKTYSHTYDENGEMIYEYILRYDEKGSIIEELKYDNRGIQAGIIQYIYKYY